jgi:hypothetical protein
MASAGSAAMLAAQQNSLRDLNLDDNVEDIIVTLSSQIHLVRPLTDISGKGLAICLILDKARSNLAMARLKLSKIEKNLKI